MTPVQLATAQKMSRELGAQDAIIRRLREALETIVRLPPGSRGAYGKFHQAQTEAKAALATFANS